jgi:hypothetical protein|tara:strand:- start:1136 stop:1366 length:231 start_codon:yes stop_codon:yes gene_type:complete
MAQTIKLKRSSSAGAIPGTGDLALGEVAINTADGRMYMKDGANSIVWINKTSEITGTTPQASDGTNKPVGYVWYVV